MLVNEGFRELNALINSSMFLDLLKDNNLTLDDGNKIKNQLTEEIKQGTIDENNLAFRLKYLINHYSQKNSKEDLNFETKTCPKCYEKQDIHKDICEKCGHDFTVKKTKSNKKQCPNCLVCVPKTIVICPHCNYNFNSKNSSKSSDNVERVSKSKNISFKGNDSINSNKINISKGTKMSEYDKFKRNTKFLANYDFYFKLCPKCESKLLIDDSFCYNCGLDVVNIVHEKPKISDFLKFKRKTIFLANYDFYFKLCPKCGSKLLIDDIFCYNCGKEVMTNDNQNKKSTKSNTNKSIKIDEDLNFNIVYFLYLDAIRKNPKKKFSKRIAKKYNITLDELEKQAISDEFIELESPLTVARNSNITVLKDILKQHNLKVSGKKEDLIERLSQNLSDEELKTYFKSENYQITIKGLDFINEYQSNQ